MIERLPAQRPQWLATGRAHLRALREPLLALDAEVDRIERWGRHLAAVFGRGGRLLAAGNGGSAAEAQHLTSELVGRYRDERHPFSAIALHAEGSSLTAIGNDYGAEQAFARQVRAHGRPGDVFVALSTSGRSPNILAAARAAREEGLTTWALTGQRSNPLTELSHEALRIQAEATATIQELHLIAIHMLCAVVEVATGTSVPYPAELADELRRER
jgi:D-sedoheptulose 7-phosphate isomerase